MPSYGRCLQHRTICSNVERLGRSGPFKNAPGFPGQFQVTRHRRYSGCGHQPLPPGMLPPLVESLARSALVNLQKCHHMVVALNTGQFAAMWKGWVVPVLLRTCQGSQDSFKSLVIGDTWDVAISLCRLACSHPLLDLWLGAPW